ncbi:MAG: hypothetical protein DCF30_11650 [Hyphomicrobiales bacterium]|nr:MAG: hypothetical protein DCF30_11650 [Hyphomicrobiales bacterium]
MLVAVTGLDAGGRLRKARWSLLAEHGDGPHVPTLPAAAAVRALLDGRLAPGARPAAGALTLQEIEAEMAPYAIATRQEHSIYRSCVFRDALGADSFAALPGPLMALHGADGPPVWRGLASIEAGTHPLARLARRIIGLPPAGHDVPVTVSIERTAGPDGNAEIWTRNFGGSRFSSRLSVDAAGGLWEAFGPIRFRLGLAARGRGLELPVTAARCLGIPLPRVLLPISDACEHIDEQGRFCFDIRLTLPGLGLLSHYRGWLVPAMPSPSLADAT